MRTYNKYMDGSRVLLGSHRGDRKHYPENTMSAFKASIELGLDAIETDVRMTKDGYLVYNHDDYIDETCNINGNITLSEVKELCRDKTKRHYIRDMTLAELESYNFGYYFEDKEGNRPYENCEDITPYGLLYIHIFSEQVARLTASSRECCAEIAG